MLIDATHAEETRVVVVAGNRLEDFDYESAAKKQLKVTSIYSALCRRRELCFFFWKASLEESGEIQNLVCSRNLATLIYQTLE